MDLKLSNNAEKISKSITLSEFEKGRALRRLVALKDETEQNIYDYLCLHGPEILPYFLEVPKEEQNFSRRAPPGKSASEWSREDIVFYGIYVNEVQKWEEIVNCLQLSEKAKKFISETSHFDASTCYGTSMKLIGSLKWNRFMKKCFFSLYYDNVETKVDELFGVFLEEILDDQCFGISCQQSFDLTVNNYDGEAKIDVCVIYYPWELAGIFFSEDKLIKNTTNEGEPQAIAEAIAVCQQKEWPKNLPIFFFKVRGFYVAFYSTCFDKVFCKLVQEGKAGIIPTTVKKFQPIRAGKKGLSLLNPNDRLVLAQILCSIEGFVKNYK